MLLFVSISIGVNFSCLHGQINYRNGLTEFNCPFNLMNDAFFIYKKNVVNMKYIHDPCLATSQVIWVSKNDSSQGSVKKRRKRGKPQVQMMHFMHPVDTTRIGETNDRMDVWLGG